MTENHEDIEKDAKGAVEEDKASVAMMDLLSNLCMIGMLSKDLHYRAKGKPFYGLHELSDKIWTIRHLSDELTEVFFLGEKGSVPPEQSAIAMKASLGLEHLGIRDFGGNNDEDAILMALYQACQNCAKAVETAKASGSFKSGTNAVLDEISKLALLFGGLIARTAKDLLDKVERARARAYSKAMKPIAEKGIVITPSSNEAAAPEQKQEETSSREDSLVDALKAIVGKQG